jgi:hypothetical protein
MIKDVYGCWRCANKQEVIDTHLAAETEPHRWGPVLVEKVATLMSIHGTRPDAECDRDRSSGRSRARWIASQRRNITFWRRPDVAESRRDRPESAWKWTFNTRWLRVPAGLAHNLARQHERVANH